MEHFTLKLSHILKSIFISLESYFTFPLFPRNPHIEQFKIQYRFQNYKEGNFPGLYLEIFHTFSNISTTHPPFWILILTFFH